MSALGDPVHRVRASVATTKAERTAQIRYSANFTDGLPGLAGTLAETHPAAARGLRIAGGTMRRVLSAVSVSTMPGPDGRIDFDNQRSVYSAGEFWKLYAPGREYVGEPGEWELAELDALSDEDPLWLLTLLEATVEAPAEGQETALGVTCERYAAFVDFGQVRPPAAWPVAPPFHARDTPFRDDQLNLSRLRFDVWLDGSGRIRRAIFHAGSGSLTQIELSGFGEPNAVQLPGLDEIVPDEDALTDH